MRNKFCLRLCRLRLCALLFCCCGIGKFCFFTLRLCCGSLRFCLLNFALRNRLLLRFFLRFGSFPLRLSGLEVYCVGLDEHFSVINIVFVIFFLLCKHIFCPNYNGISRTHLNNVVADRLNLPIMRKSLQQYFIKFVTNFGIGGSLYFLPFFVEIFYYCAYPDI